jgi:3-hydroxy acid dehydrogenase / malonic semialdehyde reductase
MPIVFITGATAGFGEAMAKSFAAANYHCIITGRRNERLQQLATQLQQQYGINVLPLNFDIQNKEAVFAAVNNLPNQWKNIDVLINNAGLAAGRDTFNDALLSDWETMIDTNLKGLMYISKAIAPIMIANKKGHIINIGSTAGKEVYKDGNMYCATKHAVDALSKSMRIDLLPYNIKVTAIHPGAAETEFSMVRFKGDESKAQAVYNGYTALQAADVANIALYCAQLPAHVCINDLVVTCTAQANSFYLHK